MSDREFQSAVFWLSYLVFPWLVVVGWQLLRRPPDRVRRAVWGVLLGLTLVFIYARFVEPNFLIVREEILSGGGTVPVRIAVVSDLHIGVFRNDGLVQRVADTVRAAKPDLLLIPGDFINDPSPEQLAHAFAPLGKLEIPVYGVTGNHDARVPGDYSSGEVRQALSGLVTDSDNQVQRFEKNGRFLNIYGLSDLMEGEADYSILRNMREGEFNLILTHNPDTAHLIPDTLPVSLLVSGHTHGGQIFLPPFSYWIIPTVHPFVRGWYEVSGFPVYVSSGAGQVLLPLRFLVPPEVVIMEVKI